MSNYNRRAKVDPTVNRSKVFAVPRIGVAISQANPLRSIGLACHRDDVGKYNEFLKSKGVTGAYHDKDGTCVIESRQARNQVLKARNLRDNDAGYGDWAGEN